MGFCRDGGLAVRAAQVLDIDAGIAFYGTRLADRMNAPLKAPFLAHFGARDDHAPEDLRNQVIAYFPGIEAHVYDAGHAFANDARPAHVPEAADLAHARTEAFLKRTIG